MKRLIISILNITISILALGSSQDTVSNHILNQANLADIRYSDLKWAYTYNFKFKNPLNSSQNLFLYIIPEITYDCSDNYESGLAKLNSDYFEIRFHYLLWDQQSNNVLDHFIDKNNYENDAIRIQNFECKSNLPIKPNHEALEINISYGHRLRYNPYLSNRKIIFTIGEGVLREILDMNTYSIWGEVSDTCEYDMNMRSRLLQFDQSHLFNGYYPLEVEEISRVNDGEKRCGDLEGYNDTIKYKMYYKNGAYRK